MIKKFFAVLLLTFFLVSITACVVYRPHGEPPPPRSEVRSHKPGPNYIWVQGHWEWRRGDWNWVRGHWIKTRPGRIWVPGHYELRRGHRVWVPGHWRRK